MDRYGFIFCRRCNKYFAAKKKQGRKKKNEKIQRAFYPDSQEVSVNGQ